ncbi:MAG: hypothetical protein EHM42_10455, partial [Planctomycetaceae bacterium]
MPLLLPLAVLVSCAALLLAPRQLLADAGEAREYVDKAHDHLAASDTLAVDNLLRLAEAALDDVAMDEQAPLRSEIEELRRQFESDTTARRARLLVQRIDRLFEDAEMTLGMIEGGGTATLRRIEQLLAEPDSANTLGTTHFEKYRRRLTLFRRAHERKLREKGVAPDLTPRVELEDPDPESRPERPAASAGSNEASTATSPATQPKTPVPKPRLGVEGETKQPAVGNSSQGDVPISDQPRPIYLFGGTQSNASLLSRMWKLLV